MTERSIATCHCGAVKISFEMEGGLDGLRRCDCSICRRKYPAAVSGRRDDVVIEQGAENLSTYQFGTMTAKHHFCKTCGIHVYHNRRSNPLEIGVNVACVEGLPPRIAGDARWVDGVVHPNDA
ncbi:GFA family protein [uncultured Litoreibacter sp.]|uniref:GFA family protein n=1 Tax=uncultured Litoreibacter sp. TaxID=1392394 RepID=UPI00261F542E|nr:GFA family protein [uncultured Litoreibacter sp.]